MFLTTICCFLSMQSFIIHIYADCGTVRGCNHVLHCPCHSVRFYSCLQDESAVSSYSLTGKWGKKWYSSSLSFVLIWIVFVLCQSSPRMISAVTGFVFCVWDWTSKILAGHCTYITFRPYSLVMWISQNTFKSWSPESPITIIPVQV